MCLSVWDNVGCANWKSISEQLLALLVYVFLQLYEFTYETIDLYRSSSQPPPELQLLNMAWRGQDPSSYLYQCSLPASPAGLFHAICDSGYVRGSD
jgi:hypothetical protein